MIDLQQAENLLTTLQNAPDDVNLKLIVADYIDENSADCEVELKRVDTQCAELEKQPGWLPKQSEWESLPADRIQMLFRLNNFDREKKLEILQQQRKLLAKITWANACDLRLQAQMQVVITDKDNDEPRLEYANICERYGRNDRAEFIRVQCELARFPRCPTGLSDGFHEAAWKERRNDLLARQKILTVMEPVQDSGVVHGRRWRARAGIGVEQEQAYQWMPVGAIAADWSEFRRGFVEGVTLDSRVYIEHIDKLLKETPLRKAKVTPVGLDQQEIQKLYYKWYERTGEEQTVSISEMIEETWPEVAIDWQMAQPISV